MIFDIYAKNILYFTSMEKQYSNINLYFHFNSIAFCNMHSVNYAF